MRISLLKVAREDEPQTKKTDQRYHAKQRAEKQRKEELLSEYRMMKSSELFIDALCYHEIYCSDACWKISVMVEREIAKIISEKSKIDVLKENIGYMP